MLQTLKNAWRTPDIRKKLLYVLLILLLYRIGTVIPVPFVDASTFSENFGDTIFAYLNLLSGGALSAATLFALGVSPYITASIVIQLLSVAIPPLGRKIQDGEAGKAFSEKLNRYCTVALAILTGYGYYALLKSNKMLTATATNASKPVQVLIAIVIVTCYVAGATLVMWLGEKINEKGLGNGISLILFANIIASFPSTIYNLVWLIIYAGFKGQATGWKKAGYISGSFGFVLGYIAVLILISVFVIWVTGSERRIPIQYSKQVKGRKMYGGQSTTLPIKLNMAGVMPIIFASSIISLPATIMTLCGVKSADALLKADANATVKFSNKFYDFMAADGWFYPLMFVVLIILFSYFYITISFNPVEVANNLKANGGRIPGIREGRPTADRIRKVLNKVTLMGAFFLAIIAVLPMIGSPLVITPIVTKLLSNAGVTNATTAASYASTFAFGGTSLLIVIGVVQETYRELEAQLTMRNYKGFL